MLRSMSALISAFSTALPSKLTRSLPTGLILLLVLSAGFLPAFSHAATITISCVDPTKRTDGSSLASAEIASRTYAIGSTKFTSTSAACGYKYTVPTGSTIAKGTTITALVTDTGGLSSSASSTTLSEDATTPKAPPNAPGNVQAVVGDGS